MSDMKTHRERLDALLTGLEDEVLRSGGRAQALLEEGEATMNVEPTRSAIESLIGAQLGGPEGRHKSLLDDWTGTKGAKGMVARTVERLGNWANVRHAGGIVQASPRVRMAFSGEQSQKRGKVVRGAEKQRGQGKDSGGDVNR